MMGHGSSTARRVGRASRPRGARSVTRRLEPVPEHVHAPASRRRYSHQAAWRRACAIGAEPDRHAGRKSDAARQPRARSEAERPRARHGGAARSPSLPRAARALADLTRALAKPSPARASTALGGTGAAKRRRGWAGHWPAGQEANRKRTAERYAEAKQKIGSLTLKVSEGAEITVNGKSVGKSPLPGPVFVSPGAATVIATIGDKTMKKTVALDVGESREVEIVIEGEAAAVGPVAPPSENGSAGASASGSATGDVKPPTGSSFKTIGMIASGAVAVIGLGVGVGFYMKKQSAKDEAEGFKDDSIKQVGAGGCPESGATGACADLADANDRAKSARTISTVGFIGAGVGAAAFVAFVLMPSKKHSAVVHPVLDRHTAGLAAYGSF